ncbi:LuxR C-terminal-related transcriptional regulator [Serratia sp. L9]|uniref:helix-turn-helix transcriptional regulator n=1 Tax=Serratia sp. L9 TaxID=3423946 RepID=UPI003D6796A9
MNVLYLGEKNIGSLGIIRIVETSYPESNIVLKSVEECTSKILSEFYDICIIDGKKLEATPLSSFQKFLLMPNVPILILAKKEQPLHKYLNYLSNVRGMIEYESGVEFFLNAINVVQTGGYCYSWDIYALKSNNSALFNEEYCESVGLTRREMEILKMYLDGATNKEISVKLSRSQKTISAHKSNILRKIGTKRLPASSFRMESMGHQG